VEETANRALDAMAFHLESNTIVAVFVVVMDQVASILAPQLLALVVQEVVAVLGVKMIAPVISVYTPIALLVYNLRVPH